MEKFYDFFTLRPSDGQLLSLFLSNNEKSVSELEKA
jgi:hypothetical protein